jgi:hypothetical protein
MKLRSNLVLCSAFTLSLLSANLYAGNTWGTYHWARTANPMTIKVIDSLTPEWDTAYKTTLQEWSWSPLLDLTQVGADDSLTTRQNCPSVSGQIRVCNYAYGVNGWLGLASIGVDANGHIDRARARMNDSYASYWGILGEMNHVMCQEVGHLFGLDHTSVDGSSQASCMDYSTDVSSQWPNGADFDTLVQIYGGHVDSYNSYSTATSTAPAPTPTPTACTPKGKSSKCSTAASASMDAEMGVKISGNSKKEMWVARRSDGGLWIHIVYLADAEHAEDHNH